MNPNWINPEEYPFTPKEFDLPMGTLRYVDEGQGLPIVMVPGNPSWSFEYRALLKHFSETRRVIAPDHIGFGLSAKPVEWDYLPEQHAKNLESLLDYLDLYNITLVVGDWGGPLGLSYAIKHPERIKNIVITNTWMWSVKSDLYYRGFSGFVGGPIGRWMIRRYNFFAGSLLKSIYGDKSKLTPEIHRHYLKPLEKVEERKGNMVFPKQIIGSSDWLAELWSQRDVLQGKLKAIVWGMKDIAFREKELRHWTKYFPAAEEVRLLGAGHLVADEEPEALIDVIEALG
jgi:haloalkane dehalogenase